jgi:hypothetical protein
MTVAVNRPLVALAALATFALAGPAAGFDRLPPAAPAGQLVFYGHVRSLTRSGGGYVLRFDPAWLLEGVTAQRAAVEDGVLPAGEPVPNDNYTRDADHRLLTFVVPRTARVTVLTNDGTKGIASTRVTVGELAQILKGKNPRHRKLFGSAKESGFWARVAIDKVRSLDEQYHP